jgi:hypothetical protein
VTIDGCFSPRLVGTRLLTFSACGPDGLGAVEGDCRMRIKRRRPALRMSFRLSVPQDALGRQADPLRVADRPGRANREHGKQNLPSGPRLLLFLVETVRLPERGGRDIDGRGKQPGVSPILST